MIVYGSPAGGPLPTLLRGEGFSAVAVASADEAVDVARRDRPAAVALVAAAGLDTAEVLLSIKRRADLRHLPVFVFDEDGSPAPWWGSGAAFVAAAPDDETVRAMISSCATTCASPARSSSSSMATTSAATTSPPSSRPQRAIVGAGSVSDARSFRQPSPSTA